MSSLVNYESGDESDDDDRKLADERRADGDNENQNSTNGKKPNWEMEDEWDSFEKMIQEIPSDLGSTQKLICYPSYKQSTNHSELSSKTGEAKKSENKDSSRKFLEEKSEIESKKNQAYDPHDNDNNSDDDDDSDDHDKMKDDSDDEDEDECKSDDAEKRTSQNKDDNERQSKRQSDKTQDQVKKSPESRYEHRTSKKETNDNNNDEDDSEDDSHRDKKNKMEKKSPSLKRRRRSSRSRSRDSNHRHRRRHHRHHDDRHRHRQSRSTKDTSRKSRERHDDSKSSSQSPRNRDKRHKSDKKKDDREGEERRKKLKRSHSRSRSHSRHHHRRRRRHHSRSSSDSLPRFTRAVVPLKPQTVIVPPKKSAKSNVAPTMKSGTTLPAMFAELQNSDFKEQLRAMFVEAQTKSPDEIAKEIQLDESKLITAKEKKSALPLNNLNPLAAMVASGSKATPQQALSQTMAAMHAKVQEITGVAVPKYYNPSAVNPLKYAEQLKKRKMLWSKNKDATAVSAAAVEPEKEAEVKPDLKSQLQWTGTSFSADQDGKMAAKFKKLMGIKQDGAAGFPTDVDISKLSEEQRKKQEELFQQLDREYEFARMATHTCRGVGFGFASHNLPGT